MIIAFGGIKGSGKNTAASLLVSRGGFQELSFARPLKEACSKAMDMPYIWFDDQAHKELPFTNPVPLTQDLIDNLILHLSKYRKFTDSERASLYEMAYKKYFVCTRDMLQYVATDLIRNKVDPNFWVEAMRTELNNTVHAVVTDARFPNERKLIRECGGKLFLIKRPGLEAVDGHVSENSLGEEKEYDAVFVNDGHPIQLQVRVREWLVQHGEL